MQVATGYRFQVRQNLSTWVGRLWQERPPRYSRALLETLSLIAYRQPITRGEIEEIRGVAVSTNIIKTLQERDWVRIVGHRDVPGRPAMYATTRQFLDYFNLKSLEELPPLAEIKDLENLSGDLPLEILGAEIAEPETEANAPAIDAETADEMPAGNTSEEPSSEGEHSEAQVAEERALEQDIAGDTGLDAEDATEGAPELAAPKEQSPTEQASDEIHADGELSHEQSPAPAK